MLLACAGVIGIVYYFLSQPVHLKIAVGPTNSEDVRVVQAIAQQLARDHAKVRLKVLVKEGGTREARAAIDNNEVDLAVVRRDIGLPKDGQVVAVWRKNVAVFIVPEPEPAKAAPAAKGKKKAKAAKAAKEDETSKIEKIEHLMGKRLGVIGSTPANIDLLKIILSQYRIPPEKLLMVATANDTKTRVADKVTVILLPTTNVGAAIREAKLDAILAVGPVSSAITADAISAATRNKEPPTFLDIDAAEAIAGRSPIYEATEIKAGAFGGAPARPAESVDTIGVNHYIVARRKLSDGTVADFTKALFAIRQALAAEVPSTAKIEKADTDKDASVPVHPGAAAFYDGEIKSFFDRYNDLLYWGLMIFSFFGSAIAGLASYSKSDDRARRLQALQQLLELTKTARGADAIAQLDQVQEEIDRVLAQMIQEVEKDALDESAISAFSVMVDQAQMAIAERRAVLTDQPPRPRVAVASL
jgi:TRAP-type uncharacterized transport system substrate-binding protein